MKIALSPVTAVCCDAESQVIEDAVIHVEDNRISYVGPLHYAPPFDADETLGGPHLVALPGLVNTHTHAAMTLCRGYADDMALEPWLNEKIWPYERNLEAHHVYIGTLLAIAEMTRGGTTTFCDMYFFEREGVRAALEMATIGGAKCLGLENEIGSLEAGKKADICLVDFDKPHLTPRHNVVSHLVYAAGASDVHSVMVDGKWLLRGGEFQTLESAQICAEAESIARELVTRA
jgi:cytosine/adenosine deaminase-related metal-dependent hydrolase